MKVLWAVFSNWIQKYIYWKHLVAEQNLWKHGFIKTRCGFLWESVEQSWTRLQNSYLPFLYVLWFSYYSRSLSLRKIFDKYFEYFQFSLVQSLSCVQLFATPGTAAHQASLSTTNSRSPPKPMSIKSVMPSNHLILCSPSPPALNHSQHRDLFKMSQLCLSGDQSIGVSASASVLPMKT